MLLLAGLAQRLLRPVNGVDFLAAAALLLLLDNPFCCSKPDFSYLSALPYRCWYSSAPLQQRLQWIGWRWLRDSVAVVLAAYLGSLSLGAWHFYRFVRFFSVL